MNILIAGANGMLGTDMILRARADGHEITALDLPEIDITDKESLQKIITERNPDLILNCAAFTAVDECESKQDIAFNINANGPGNLAQCAESINASLVHISTDYVFDGTKSIPYVETDRTNPKTVYGKSKLEGEKQVLSNCSKAYVFRIAWLYGTNGNNFVKTIRNAAIKKESTGEALRVVNDQWGTPTWTIDVCNQILKVIKVQQYGLYHCTSEGSCTWFDFAKEIVALSGLTTPVLPCTTEEYPRPAPRPKYSVLENENLKKQNLNLMRDWKEALREFFILENKNMEGAR